MSISDDLHDEIDAVEALIAKGRDMVRDTRSKELRDIMARVAKDAPKQNTPYDNVLIALRVLSAKIAAGVNGILTEAAKDGVERGKRRGK